MITRHLFRTTAVLVFSLVFATSALADWTVTILNVAGAANSSVTAVSDGQQVGYAKIGSDYHAGLWTGAAATWVDLNPAGSTDSSARGVAAGQQVGCASIGGYTHAGFWNGTAASWTDIHPAGYASSCAFDTDGSFQAGSAGIDGVSHAGMWQGTAGSWVDLHPAGATCSLARRVAGGQQVGQVYFGGLIHGGLWTGSASSWVDLTPAWSSYSDVYDTDGTRQVGMVQIAAPGFTTYHAAMWSGTVASFVDLHDDRFGDLSGCFAISGDWQAGAYRVGFGYNEEGWPSYEIREACLWHGTADSWVPLHGRLPSGYESSEALDIWAQGDELWVTGRAVKYSGGEDAVLWHFVPVPEPSSLLALGSGLLAVGGLIRRRR